ncbi:MAG: aerobic carbon-monoxide dehydrogenase medium subunit [Thermoleophilaceae bacterium]|nr:aerobic carbon-monoxide dehydrogenase medium subunit [Thermoleophilaceae bacterium]
MQVPAPFEYERATSVEDAIARLGRLGPEARVIAGGHSLLPMMKLRLAAPEHLVDVNDLDELDYIRDEGELAIGALTRHKTLLASEVLAEHYPIFRDAEKVIADPVVRNRGTIGGALCQADPSEDLSAVCAACQASLVIQGPDGQRTVSMDEFHVGPYETAVGDGEMLVEVRLPLRFHTGSAYEKVERRRGDWAVAAVGAHVWMYGEAIRQGGIGLAALGPQLHAPRAEEALAGNTPSEELYEQVGQIVAEDCSPTDDNRGPVDYKRHLAAELTKRALRRAVERVVD